MDIGTIGEIINKMKSGVWDYTKEGHCSNCGNCCADLLPISEAEIRKIKKYIREHNIKEQIHRPPTVNSVWDLTCPFRNNKERRCEIYPVRPLICKEFKCDKPSKEIEASKELIMQKNRIVRMRHEFFPKGEKLR